MMVVLSSGNLSFQKSFLQSTCRRIRELLVDIEVRRRREEYCRTGACFSLFAQRRFLRFPRTMMRDLARSCAMFSSLFIFMTQKRRFLATEKTLYGLGLSPQH